MPITGLWPGEMTSLEASAFDGLTLSRELKKEQKWDFSHHLNCFTSVCGKTASSPVLGFICLWFLKLRKGCVIAVGNQYMQTSATSMK